MNTYQKIYTLVEDCCDSPIGAKKDEFKWRKREFTRETGLDSVGAYVTSNGSSVNGRIELGNGNSIWFDGYSKQSCDEELKRIEKICDLMEQLKKQFKKATSKLK